MNFQYSGSRSVTMPSRQQTGEGRDWVCMHVYSPNVQNDSQLSANYQQEGRSHPDAGADVSVQKVERCLASAPQRLGKISESNNIPTSRAGSRANPSQIVCSKSHHELRALDKIRTFVNTVQSKDVPHNDLAMDATDT